MNTPVEAPAKLTLSLRITGVRADGYHLIDAEMVTLALADELVISPQPDDAAPDDPSPDGALLSVSGPFADGVPVDSRNLVSRALRLVGRRAAVHVVKRIPHGGGLGGGSADAAAVLRWAGFTDLHAAATIGADVAFCLVGGRARVRGIGELVEPLPDRAPQPVTLIVPPLHVATPRVYAAWDELAAEGHATPTGANDLEPAAINAYPELGRWRDRIREAAGAAPALAGSGATWYLLGEVGAPGQQGILTEQLSAALPEAQIVATTTRA